MDVLELVIGHFARDPDSFATAPTLAAAAAETK
jgi:hypothetical protein